MVHIYRPKTASLWAFFFEFSIKNQFPAQSFQTPRPLSRTLYPRPFYPCFRPLYPRFRPLYPRFRPSYPRTPAPSTPSVSDAFF